ncbi:MAG: c-type cytochrome [Thiobacillaceae bacterium]
MASRIRPNALLSILASTLLFSLSPHASAADEEAAKELARANNCFKCHGISKAKDGPSWTSVAEKLRGNPDAETKLIRHLTTGEMAKFPDGHEEHHKIINTKDMGQIKNLVNWILSL